MKRAAIDLIARGRRTTGQLSRSLNLSYAETRSLVSELLKEEYLVGDPFRVTDKGREFLKR